MAEGNLRHILDTESIVVSPGVYDGYSARLVEQAGYRLASTTGAGLANARLGVPDIGVMSLRDNVEACRHIARSVNIPVSADAETGYGNAVTVYHVVRYFEEAGVAAVSIEDQVIPKRCGHIEGKEIISALDMARKIEAAVAARRNPDFLIVARTDAIAVEGIEGAAARARMYQEAGADVIFPDAVRGRDDIARIVDAVSIPVRINMGFGIRTRATTPLMSVRELERLGVKWVSLARMLPAAAIRAMTEALRVMRESIETGEVMERADLLADMNEIKALMGYDEFFELERRFLSDDERHAKYGRRNG